MLSPIVGYGLRAVLWMQGEANSNEGFPLHRDEYACAFGAMIDAWRAAFRAPPMWFGFVQIAGCTPQRGSNPQPANWRESADLTFVPHRRQLTAPGLTAEILETYDAGVFDLSPATFMVDDSPHF